MLEGKIATELTEERLVFARHGKEKRTGKRKSNKEVTREGSLNPRKFRPNTVCSRAYSFDRLSSSTLYTNQHHCLSVYH